jgi:FSR family fosmidomycin resistance protein-like MFS transporter
MAIEISADQEKFHTSGVSVVSAAHSVHDTYTAFLPALLPVLIEKFTLSNTTAGLLSVFLQLPSLLQPLIGHLADRKNLRYFIILTPALTGAAMSLLSIAPTYSFLVFLLVIAGFSSAALHAVGPILAGTFSGSRLGRGMSFWMVGGEMGRALGPLVVVTALGYIALHDLPWLMLAGILVSVFLYQQLKNITTQPLSNGNGLPWIAAIKSMAPIMLPLFVLIFARAMMVSTLSTFLPTFLTSEGATLWIAGASLSILEAAGVVGAFLAGSLSDRLGRRKMLLISFIATPFFMLIFTQTTGIFQIPFLILMGFFGISITPVLMAIVQENFPNNRSLANGIYMAFNFVLMAVAVLLVGIISDQTSLRITFYISAAMILVGLPFIRLLPKSRKAA